MKLIKTLPELVDKWPNGVNRYHGLFECVFCKKQVQRPLITGHKASSCGCLKRGWQVRKHGMSGKPIYHVWQAMHARCNGADELAEKYYRSRRITVCAEWHEAAIFIRWALANGYRRGLLLDRRDNDKGYSPDNCRFVTYKESANNTRKANAVRDLNSAIISALKDGVSAREIGRKYGISHTTISRINHEKHQ